MICAVERAGLTPYVSWSAQNSSLPAVILVENLKTPECSFLSFPNLIIADITRVQVQHGRSAQLKRQPQMKLSQMNVTIYG